jgi:hypothetical protein
MNSFTITLTRQFTRLAKKALVEDYLLFGGEQTTPRSTLKRWFTRIVKHTGVGRMSEVEQKALVEDYLFGGGQVQQHEAVTRRLVRKGILTPPGPNARFIQRAPREPRR